MNDEVTIKQIAHAQTVQQEASDKSLLGFWVYLMTDCVLFASLFATYAVLHKNTFGGPSGHDLFTPRLVLLETLLLLTSSFTCGLMMLAARAQQKKRVLQLLGLTGLLGAFFLLIELTEFRHLVIEGNNWRRSGFLSAFFTLVGTHGLHILTGLLWLSVLIVKIVRGGLGHQTVKRLSLFSLFWHFLDVVWIFIFTIVYLLGIVSA